VYIFLFVTPNTFLNSYISVSNIQLGMYPELDVTWLYILPLPV